MFNRFSRLQMMGVEGPIPRSPISALQVEIILPKLCYMALYNIIYGILYEYKYSGVRSSNKLFPTTLVTPCSQGVPVKSKLNTNAVPVCKIIQLKIGKQEVVRKF